MCVCVGGGTPAPDYQLSEGGGEEGRAWRGGEKTELSFSSSLVTHPDWYLICTRLNWIGAWLCLPVKRLLDDWTVNANVI